jgi:hypothetical protein
VDPRTEAALTEFSTRLGEVDGVVALWVGGSLATGDHVPGVSDLDLVALTDGQVDRARIGSVHRDLDAGAAHGMDLGCQYLDRHRLADLDAEHPTWTHGELLDRIVSSVTRAELVLHGYALTGPEPQAVLPAVRPGDVRRAAQAELAGYWSWAARHPRMFVRHPVMVDLGLTGMARGRHALEHDALLTKSAAVEQAHAPEWLKDQVRARRRGEAVRSPRWRAAYVAWRDVRRTTSAAPGPQP